MAHVPFHRTQNSEEQANNAWGNTAPAIRRVGDNRIASTQQSAGQRQASQAICHTGPTSEPNAAAPAKECALACAARLQQADQPVSAIAVFSPRPWAQKRATHFSESSS